MMSNYAFFSKDPSWWGNLQVSLGVPWYLSTIRMVSCCLHDSIRTLLSYQPEGLGQSREVQKWCCFSSNPDWGTYSRGQSIWLLHDVGTPYQTRVSTMEEAVKQLTPMIPTGPNLPYALVQLNGDAHHVPLPMEGTWALWWKVVLAVSLVEG